MKRISTLLLLLFALATSASAQITFSKPKGKPVHATPKRTARAKASPERPTRAKASQSKPTAAPALKVDFTITPAGLNAPIKTWEDGDSLTLAIKGWGQRVRVELGCLDAPWLDLKEGTSEGDLHVYTLRVSPTQDISERKAYFTIRNRESEARVDVVQPGLKLSRTKNYLARMAKANLGENDQLAEEPTCENRLQWATSDGRRFGEYPAHHADMPLPEGYYLPSPGELKLALYFNNETNSSDTIVFKTIEGDLHAFRYQFYVGCGLKISACAIDQSEHDLFRERKNWEKIGLAGRAVVRNLPALGYQDYPDIISSKRLVKIGCSQKRFTYYTHLEGESADWINVIRSYRYEKTNLYFILRPFYRGE